MVRVIFKAVGLLLLKNANYRSMKVVATNRKARYNYRVIETYEAGIALKGSEVKSLRSRGCSLEESFVSIETDEAFLYNMHISEFEKSSYFKLDPRRVRKLLLHHREIDKLSVAASRQGFTLVPLRVYFNQRGIAKVEVALAKGKHTYDKRRKIKDEIVKREAARALKKFQGKG